MTPDPSSSELPPAEECVLSHLLRRHATSDPDAVHAVFGNGAMWTFSDAWREANAVASQLRELGVRQGDRVLTWFPNGPEALRAWYGINLLGAVYVPLNTAYRGKLLSHAVGLCGARVALVDPDLIEDLADVRDSLDHVVALGADDWRQCPDEPVEPESPIEPWDPYAIIYTSGTTGPSKGVLVTYAQIAITAAAFFGSVPGTTTLFGPDDRYLINSPLFHAASTNAVVATLLAGGSIAVVDRFDTATFWETVRDLDVSHATLLGVMATFLAKRPASQVDRDHSLKHVFMVPLIDDLRAFRDRFGVDVSGLYNMTETSVPIVTELNPETLGTCGRLRPGVEGRLVDEHDREVGPGEVGELILRATLPWTICTDYYGMPEATVAAWRNGWFHTGDAFRCVDGEYYFVDRRKDAIRRRGENISSFEVEAEMCAHPAVRECAAVAVPSPYGEEDLLVALSLVDGAQVSAVELLEFARDRMAHFMVPRYIRIIDELPKTPTSKVEKHRLRAEGVTADTWDRDAAGLRIGRRR